jgi:hypothetical protein
LSCLQIGQTHAHSDLRGSGCCSGGRGIRTSSKEIPEASTASLRAVRELAAVVLVLVKAVEAVVDVLGHQWVQTAPAPSRYGYRNSYEFDDDDDEQR